MELDRHLARTMLSLHPVESARILETLPPTEAAEILAEIELTEAARVMERMTPTTAARVVDVLNSDQIGPFLLALPLHATAAILRPLDPGRRHSILETLPKARAEEVRPLLELGPGTAGAVMDPDILILPREIRVSEAIQRLRQRPEAAAEVLYLVDRDRVLVGSVSLIALMTARGEAQLLSLLLEPEHTLVASAGLRAILSHPGWRLATSIPVIDSAGVLLGALDHGALRRLEDEVQDGRIGGNETTEALGDLFRAALGGVLDSLLAPARPGKKPVSGVDP